jgi:hypothetical protein
VAEEEHNSTYALARVDVTSEVTFVVGDEMCRARAPLVPQTIVQRAYNVAQDPLDGLLVLHRRLLHELAHIPDSERQVRSGMNQVAQATDKMSVLHHINLLCLAIVAQLQPLLHRSVDRAAATHAS